MQGISRRQVYKGVAGGSQRKENVASPIMIGRSRNVQTIMCFLQKIPNGTGSVCVLRARSRTGRRAAARDQQSGGLLVSPRADSRHLHQARLPLPRRALQTQSACFFAREYAALLKKRYKTKMQVKCKSKTRSQYVTGFL